MRFGNISVTQTTRAASLLLSGVMTWRTSWMLATRWVRDDEMRVLSLWRACACTTSRLVRVHVAVVLALLLAYGSLPCRACVGPPAPCCKLTGLSQRKRPRLELSAAAATTRLCARVHQCVYPRVARSWQ